MEHVDPEIKTVKDDSGTWHCLICNKINARQDRINHHFIKNHGENGTGDLVCLICSDRFNFTLSYNEHLKESHMVEGPLKRLENIGDGAKMAKDGKGIYVCLECGYVNKRQDRFHLHFYKSHPSDRILAEEKQNQLEVANIMTNMSNYINSEHSNNKEYSETITSHLCNVNTKMNNNNIDSKNLLKNTSNVTNAEINNNPTISSIVKTGIPENIISTPSISETHLKMKTEDAARESQNTFESTRFCYGLGDEVSNYYRFLRNHSFSYDAILCVTSCINKNTLVHIQCHQLLLNVSSPLFKEMLNNADIKKCNCAYFYLPYINEQDANYILHFIYNSNVLIPKVHLTSFLTSASKLMIKGINYEEAHTFANTKENYEIKAEKKVDSNNNEMKPETHNEAKKEESSNVINTGTFALEQQLHNSINYNVTSLQSNMKPVKTEVDHIKNHGVKSKVKSKNINSENNSNKAGRNPENTEASNIVYKEWKYQFSSMTNGDSFNCHQCPEVKSFTLESSLRRHYRQSHEKSCKCCKLPFYDDDALKLHMFEKHEFRCMVCGKSFTLKSSLRRHHEKAHKDIAM